jgi:hypothetical protein
MKRWIAVTIAWALAGCSSTGSVSSPTDGTPTDAAGDSIASDASAIDTSLVPFDTAACPTADGATRAPVLHRPVANACPRTGLTTSACADADASSCTGLEWRTCTGGFCDYDQCLTDADCGATGLCSCKGETRYGGAQSYGNVCVPSDCRTDADCCPGQWCSPSDDRGGFYGVHSYHCHTSQDTCIDDADCASDAARMICAFDPVTGHWACRDYGGAG